MAEHAVDMDYRFAIFLRIVRLRESSRVVGRWNLVPQLTEAAHPQSKECLIINATNPGNNVEIFQRLPYTLDWILFNILDEA